MKHVNDLAGHELTWSAANWRGSEYHLRAGGEDAAALRFHGWLHARATVESGDGCWRLSNDGFLQTRVTIRGCDDDRPLAVFRSTVWNNGGTLELADGRRYAATSNFWMTSYQFATEDGTPLVRYRLGGIIKHSVAIDIQPAASAMPELSWLVMLGWYLNVQLQADSNGC